MGVNPKSITALGQRDTELHTCTAGQPSSRPLEEKPICRTVFGYIHMQPSLSRTPAPRHTPTPRHAHPPTPPPTHTHTRTHTCTHKHMRTHTHTNAGTHTHTHKH